MKTLIVCLMIVSNSYAPAARALEAEKLPEMTYSRNPIYVSDGFLLGYIIDFHSEGLFIWSYEGEMMLGFASGENQEIGNPWRFSTMSGSLYKDFLKAQGVPNQLVMIHYWQPILAPQFMITDTHRLLRGVYPIVPDSLKPGASFEIPLSDIFTKISPDIQKGFVSGRIVRISLDGWLRKSFEVVVQQGPTGNNFRKLSVSDEKMAEFIVQTMYTGRLVDIEYVGLISLENEVLRIGRAYQTPFRITKVTVKEEFGPGVRGVDVPNVK